MSYVAKILPASLISAFMLLAAGVNPVGAQGISLEDVGTAAGYNTGANIADTIGGLIEIVLGLLGVIFLLLMLYAGFLWMTAGGNEDQVSKAKKILIQTVIGLVLTLAAYAISGFVVDSIGSAFTDNNTMTRPN